MFFVHPYNKLLSCKFIERNVKIFFSRHSLSFCRYKPRYVMYLADKTLIIIVVFFILGSTKSSLVLFSEWKKLITIFHFISIKESPA